MTRSRPTARSALALITREPMGVVGAIVPWNYPMIMAAWKLGPALATGNSVVLKPSEKSPYTALRLAEIALEAGLPPGVFNVVPGFGVEAGEALALHRDVDAIGFTGSTRVGRKMLEYAGRSNLKRVYNELRQVGLRRLRRLRRHRARRANRRRQPVLQPGRKLQRPVARAGA